MALSLPVNWIRGETGGLPTFSLAAQAVGCFLLLVLAFQRTDWDNSIPMGSRRRRGGQSGAWTSGFGGRGIRSFPFGPWIRWGPRHFLAVLRPCAHPFVLFACPPSGGMSGCWPRGPHGAVASADDA